MGARLWFYLELSISMEGCLVYDVIVCCLGLPGAPPAPTLEVFNITMVMVQLQSPNDTGRLNISHYHVSTPVYVWLYL